MAKSLNKTRIVKWAVAAAGTAGSTLGLNELNKVADVPVGMLVTTGVSVVGPLIAILLTRGKLRKAAFVVFLAGAGASAYMWLQEKGMLPW